MMLGYYNNSLVEKIKALEISPVYEIQQILRIAKREIRNSRFAIRVYMKLALRITKR